MCVGWIGCVFFSLLFFGILVSHWHTYYIGDASSPHGATCIQFNGNDGSKPSSPSSPAGAGNEGLTRQQLDLISQIMQQTKQANAGINGTSGQRQTPRPRTWNMQVFIIFENVFATPFNFVEFFF